jgi:GT2 family glycosyltransferase
VFSPTLHGDLSDVHVVINSYGREAWYVERAITSVLRQKYRPASIHFIDQNDSPLVLTPVLRDEPLLHHHSFPDRVGARARNQAIGLAPDGWIAFFDDDAYWSNDYSENLRAILNCEPAFGLLAGAVLDETTGLHYSLRQRLGGRLDRFSGSKLLAGANFLVRAKVFAAVGGYDTRLGPGTALPSSEEADLCWRVLSVGTPARYAPELVIFHPPMHVADARTAAHKAYLYGLGKGALAAIWLFEKKHCYGLFEYLEMTLVPIGSLLHGLLRRDFRQLRIQPAQWWGRQRGFWFFALCRVSARS